MAGPAHEDQPIASNKKARFNYEILETVEAGLLLLGSVTSWKISASILSCPASQAWCSLLRPGEPIPARPPVPQGQRPLTSNPPLTSRSGQPGGRVAVELGVRVGVSVARGVLVEVNVGLIPGVSVKVGVLLGTTRVEVELGVGVDVGRVCAVPVGVAVGVAEAGGRSQKLLSESTLPESGHRYWIHPELRTVPPVDAAPEEVYPAESVSMML